MTTVFNTQDANALATGLGRAKLQSFSFADISALRGIVRTRILSDLGRFAIPIAVRANPEALKDFNRGLKRKPDAPVVFEFDDERHEITPEWRDYPAALANLIHLRSFEDHTLGAATMRMEMQDDGNGGKHAVPVNVPAHAGLLEFAMPTERPKTLVIATS